jgi:Flp pilus assembly protein TadB
VNWLEIVPGALIGLGVFVLVGHLMPGRPRLDAALHRIAGTGAMTPQRAAIPPLQAASRRLIAVTWLRVPMEDLALLGQDPEQWLTSKIALGLCGFAIIPVLTVMALSFGYRLPLTVPVIASIGMGAALFFAPDLVTRVNAAEKRADFRHALSSYLDLVSLERGSGAGPTEALEAAAQIGGGWAFARIAGALEDARKASRPPWHGLASLAELTGVVELADLAEIAEVAGHEGARILQTLTARAESMRAEALATTRAKAGSRSTTMVVPIALLASGFLVLLIFPIVYRTFG